MKSTTLKGRIALVVGFAMAVAVSGATLMYGCSSIQAASAVPADHYEGGVTTAAIDNGHSRCVQCHDGIVSDFTEVSDGSSVMQVHLAAWNDYQNGSASAESQAIIDENKALMEQCFAVDANGQNCNQCHETVPGENGMISVGDFNSQEFCLTCHDQEAIVQATANWHGDEKVNPHLSHLGVISCDNCHKIHAEQETMYCDECHDWGAPEGEDAADWDTAVERYSQVR